MVDYLYQRDLYHQQRDALYSAELPYEDQECKLRREVVLEQNVDHNLLT